MSIEGRLNIELHYANNCITQLKVLSNRPVAASLVFVGKTPEQLLSLLPVMYAVCGNAHAYAAFTVCSKTQQIEVDPLSQKARHLLVQLETLREHCWRILLDWPVFIGRQPEKQAIKPLLQLQQRVKPLLFAGGQAFRLDSRLHINELALSETLAQIQSIVQHTVFQGQSDSFLALQSLAELIDWLAQKASSPLALIKHVIQQQWQGMGSNRISCLPVLSNDALQQHMAEDDLGEFSMFPQWQGQCFETTQLNRQKSHALITASWHAFSNGLLTRLLARLMEVASICKLIPHWQEDKAITDYADHNPQSGIGVAQVQAARGLLIHRLQLQDGRIADYRIVAPTEWNFHPQGVLQQSLKQLKPESQQQLRKQAELLIQAIDPCVQYQLIIKPESAKMNNA